MNRRVQSYLLTINQSAQGGKYPHVTCLRVFYCYFLSVIIRQSMRMSYKQFSKAQWYRPKTKSTNLLAVFYKHHSSFLQCKSFVNIP